MEEALIKRIPPHSLEAEKSVIGSMLMSRDAVITACEILNKDDFYEQQYGVLFEAMRELNEAGKPVDVVTLQESPFHAVKVQVGTPVVDAVTLRQCCRALALTLLTARQRHQHRQETYRPCLHFVDKGTES